VAAMRTYASDTVKAEAFAEKVGACSTLARALR